MGRSEGAPRCRPTLHRRHRAVGGIVLAALAVLAGLGGCGRAEGRDVAHPAGPGDVPAPYTGPLHIGPDEARNATERETGAAGRIVQCTTRVVGEYRPGRYEGGETGRTPTEGLQTGLDEGFVNGPAEGYLLERQEGDRALFTYRVDGAVKMAVVLLDGPALGTPAGWHVESQARCNQSEFPDGVLGDLEIWTDSDGRRVPTYRVVSSRGSEHCGWTAMTFLTLDEDTERQYVRRPLKEYVGDWFTEPYRRAVPLPEDAIDTGYSRQGRHLWLSADRRRAYVGEPGADTVELWPRTTPLLGCA